MADYHLYSNEELGDFGFSREELERSDPEHIQCYSISGQGFGDKETRSTNVATAMEKATGDVAVELEEIPSHSSTKKEHLNICHPNYALFSFYLLDRRET